MLKGLELRSLAVQETRGGGRLWVINRGLVSKEDLVAAYFLRKIGVLSSMAQRTRDLLIIGGIHVASGRIHSGSPAVWASQMVAIIAHVRGVDFPVTRYHVAQPFEL